MAYESYRGQGQAGGYGQSNAYGNPSPYGQAGNPYEQDTSYDAGNPYSQGQYDRQQGYEMGNVNGGGQDRILDQCRQVDAEIDALDVRRENLRRLQDAYNKASDNGNEKALSTSLEKEVDQIKSGYKALIAHMTRIKQDKESGSPRNAAQVGRIDRKAKQSHHQLQQWESEFTKQNREAQARQYRIVRPDASDAEVREATEDPNQQIFSQALLNSDRRGQAQSVASSVRARHAVIQKIEKDMLEVAQLFQDLDALVIQQEAQVVSIDQRGEEVTDHVNKGNTELDGAVTKARAARKKKWICLGIAVAIILVIIIIVVIVVLLNQLLIIIIIVIVVVVVVEVLKK